MATLTKGRTFVSGETVTPTKLNDLVDLATVTAIQTADISDGQITNAKVSDSAAIALSKLATGALPSAITVSSDNLVDGTIVNADINASAAIDGSKLADGGIGATKLSGAQSGAAPIYGCRAWVVFDGTKNTAGSVSATNTDRLIHASGNVSSVKREATGTYTINFTTALDDTDFCVLCHVTNDNVSARNCYEVGTFGQYRTTSACRVGVVNTGTTAAADSQGVSVAIFR